MNILSNIDQIANLIIRPSRYTYKSTDLGNKTFKIYQKTVVRQDFQIKNPRNLKIKGSIYSSQPFNQIQQILIYLHCNSGCRIQGLTYMKMAIQNNLTYVIFDFTGSGISQGKYVSLGYYETIDLQCVYNYIRQNINQTAKIILWGRSMGAVTALNFLLKRKYQISLAIFDSPFKSLRDLFIQIGKQKTNFPDFILEMAYKYLKPIIQQKADFNIQDVDLKVQNNLINNPGIFIASKQDSLVPFNQIDEIFNSYKGQKQMLFIQQGHNQARNIKLIKQIFISIRKYLNNEFFNKRQKKNLYSFLPQKKQMSKKKLELTIKSLSQKHLITGKTFREHKQEQIRQSVTPVLEKKQISCLLPHKKSIKNFEIQEQEQKKIFLSNKSQSKLKIKRKPFQIKNFFAQNSQSPQALTNREQNVVQYKTLKRLKRVQCVQIQQNYSDIKNESGHKNKINFHPAPKEQQFLKRCQSLQNVQKVLTDASSQLNKQSHTIQIKSTYKNKSNIETPINLNFNLSKYSKKAQQSSVQSNYSFHQIKCTQKVLEKIIEKQQKKQLILNIKKVVNNSENNNTIGVINSITNCHSNPSSFNPSLNNRSLIMRKQPNHSKKLSNITQNKYNNQNIKIQQENISKERKTLQHIVNKKPPFVQLKGVKNFRNSLQSKFKLDIRK